MAQAKPIAVVQVKDAFERAGVSMPEDEDERVRLFTLVTASCDLANEQLQEMMENFQSRAEKAEDEMKKLRVVVKKACANAEAVQTRAVSEVKKLQAKLEMTAAERAEQEAEAAAQSTVLTSEDLSILVGQSTEQPED